MPWIIGAAVVLLIALMVADYRKDLREDRAREHALDQFLKDWGESDDARNHTT